MRCVLDEGSLQGHAQVAAAAEADSGRGRHSVEGLAGRHCQTGSSKPADERHDAGGEGLVRRNGCGDRLHCASVSAAPHANAQTVPKPPKGGRRGRDH